MFYARILGESLIIAFCSGFGSMKFAELLLEKLK